MFKTAQAEFRAWGALNSEGKRHISPIIELTRGRKVPISKKIPESDKISKEEWARTPGIYNFERNLVKVSDAFKGSKQLIIDLTREETLSCYEINELSKSDNGYEQWINFLLKEKSNFDDLIPTLLVNPAEGENQEEYKANIQTQLDNLMENFSGVAYRVSVLLDSDFMYDLSVLKDKINKYLEQEKKFFIELDHEFIHPKTGALHADRTSKLIENIHKIIPKAEIIILSTSFPKSIGEIGNPEHDSFPIEEETLHEEITKINETEALISYGDYGSINPLRFDMITRGWRPRIDFPTSKKRIFYYREKRGEKKGGEKGGKRSYESHYISVAKKVVRDTRFEDLFNSWGVDQIKQAASGSSPGNSPSFWISVRMEIHLLQQIKRLGLK